MNECRRTADRLVAYADRSLAPAEHDEVERHLAKCPPCRDEASQQSGAHTVLRAKAGELRAEPLPAGLRSRCEALAREHRAAAAPRRSWAARLVPVTLGALLVVFAAAAALFVATQNSNTLLAAQLTADHTRCFRRHVAEGARPIDAAQVEAELAREYGWNIHVPPSRGDGAVQLVHARRCLYGEGRMPHVLYRAGGEDVSLYVLEGDSRRAADVAAFGHRSRIWTRGDTTFVLVSSLAAQNVDDAERYLMQEAR